MQSPESETRHKHNLRKAQWLCPPLAYLDTRPLGSGAVADHVAAKGYKPRDPRPRE